MTALVQTTVIQTPLVQTLLDFTHVNVTQGLLVMDSCVLVSLGVKQWNHFTQNTFFTKRNTFVESQVVLPIVKSNIIECGITSKD